MTWEPIATHWHRPTPVQAHRYTGENWAETVNWARHRGAEARLARYTDAGREHPPLLVTCWWHRSGNYAEGALQPGDWLVLTFGPHGHVEGWRDGEFACTYTGAEPQERNLPHR